MNVSCVIDADDISIGEEMIQRNQLLSPVVHHSPVVALLSSVLLVLQDDSNKD